MSEFASAAEPVAAEAAVEIKPADPQAYEHVPLSPKSHELLPQFRALLTEDMNKSLTDGDCERFLIARNCNLEKAHKMIEKYYHWYNSPFDTWKIANPALRPRDLDRKCADDKEVHMARILQYSYTGCDRDGHPIYWEKSGQIAANFGTFRKHFTDDEIIARHIHMLEMNRLRCENSSRRLGKPIYKKILVMDLASIPVFPDWHLYRTMQKFEEIDQNYYPETLKTMILINAPVYFTAIWAVVKPWMDPVTLTKVYICGSDFLPTLRLHMDDDVIPAEYGGTKENFPWTWPECFEE